MLDLLDQDVPPFIVAPAVTVTADNVSEGWMQSLRVEAPESLR
jgi:ribose transport system substrate-binding protein